MATERSIPTVSMVSANQSDNTKKRRKKEEKKEPNTNGRETQTRPKYTLQHL
jgi:hypothetical protein